MNQPQLDQNDLALVIGNQMIEIMLLRKQVAALQQPQNGDVEAEDLPRPMPRTPRQEKVDG